MNKIVLVEQPSAQHGKDFYYYKEYQNAFEYLKDDVSKLFFNLAKAID